MGRYPKYMPKSFTVSFLVYLNAVVISSAILVFGELRLVFGKDINDQFDISGEMLPIIIIGTILVVPFLALLLYLNRGKKKPFQKYEILDSGEKKPLQKYCIKCGAEILEGSKFCIKCGEKILE